MKATFFKSITMKFGLKESVVKNIENIITDFTQVKTVIIYGSRGKGNFKPGSDIDLTFIGDNLTSTLLNKISLRIDDLFLPYTFDLSVFDHIDNEDLIEHIRRAGKIFYQCESSEAIN
jgi:predicted nucleotidyltransferase